MSWMVTQLYSVIASCPTRGQRAAHLSVAKLQQSAGAGLGLETKRSALGAHLSVDMYSQTTAAATQQQHQQQQQQKQQQQQQQQSVT